MREINEEPLLYGEQGRGLAIVTLPKTVSKNLPIFVIFNAGLLHHSEPYRLNVQLSRALANQGFLAVRFDLSGKGDTPARDGVSNRDSVKQDWLALEKVLSERFGPKNLVLCGLCSGADNAIKTAYYQARVKGLVLLDPEIPKPKDHQLQRWKQRLLSKKGIVSLARSLHNRVGYVLGLRKKKLGIGIDQLRDLPTKEELSGVITSLSNSNGKILAVFTEFALDYYNRVGQFSESTGLHCDSNLITELWMPHVDHVYSVHLHRQQLIDKITIWAQSSFVK